MHEFLLRDTGALELTSKPISFLLLDHYSKAQGFQTSSQETTAMTEQLAMFFMNL